MPISSPNPMFDHLLLESSHRDDSNKWPIIGFGEEITQVELIEVNFIWSCITEKKYNVRKAAYMRVVQLVLGLFFMESRQVGFLH